MPVTLQDIATRVGVTPATVSAALRDETAAKRRISRRRVEQIRHIADQLGYRPNLAARSLRRGRTHCIGVVMCYQDHYPLNHYFYLISTYLREHGYHAVPLPMERRLAPENQQLQLLENVEVDGLLLMDYHRAAAPSYRNRWSEDHPLVFRVIDPAADDVAFPHVRIDHRRGTFELLRHVIERGWRKPYFVVEDNPDRPNPEVGELLMRDFMVQGIQDAAAATGVPIPLRDRLIRCPNRQAKGRYGTVLGFLERHALEPGTCLIHCGADGVSGTYAAIARAGLQVGRDIAVAATNATPPWEYVLPELTFVFEPHEQISRALVKAIVSEAEREPSPLASRPMVVPMRLVETGSVPPR